MKNKYKKIYFYYSGHGYRFGLETRGDITTTMSYLTLADLLYATNARDLCVIIDACYAGAAKKAFSAKREFKERSITILASSRADTTSVTRRVKVSSSGERRKVGAFTWYFSECFGDEFADDNSDGKTTLAEAFKCLRTLNPILANGAEMNDRMDPQICQNQAVTTSGQATTHAFPDLGLEIEQNTPFNAGAKLSVSMSNEVDEPEQHDGTVSRIFANQQWSINIENQVGAFNVNLKFNISRR